MTVRLPTVTTGQTTDTGNFQMNFSTLLIAAGLAVGLLVLCVALFLTGRKNATAEAQASRLLEQANLELLQNPPRNGFPLTDAN